MKIFKEYQQDVVFLLPPSLNDFVPEGHEVRIINDVVNVMDISSLMKKYEGGGAPAYHPGMMLKIIVYAYSLGIYSSRQIEQQLETNTAFMFLAGLQRPDFHTICLFRVQHAEVLPALFVETVRLCSSLGMVGLGHVAFDGTKLKANASARQTKDKAGLDKEIARIKEEMKKMLETSAKIDELEDKIYGESNGSEMPKEFRKKEKRLEKLLEARELLEREKLEKINVTDPDAPFMRDGHGRIEPSYNGQVAVDTKQQVILAAAISLNPADNAELVPMAEQVKQNVGVLPPQGSADSGYSSYDNLEYAEANKLDAYIPDALLRTLDQNKDGRLKYDKSNFHYDLSEDIYRCPEGKLLIRQREQKRKGQPPLVVYRGESCSDCPVREKCTKRAIREVFRDPREPLLEAMRAKLRTEEGKKIYVQRMYTVEPVFGNMKWNGRKLILSLRGWVKVNGEFQLMCLTHNIKKIISAVAKGTVSLRNIQALLDKIDRFRHRESEIVLVGAVAYR